MTKAPYLLAKGREGYRMGHAEIHDHMIFDGLTDAFNNYHMGMTAENLAEKYEIVVKSRINSRLILRIKRKRRKTRSI